MTKYSFVRRKPGNVDPWWRERHSLFLTMMRKHAVLYSEGVHLARGKEGGMKPTS